MNPLNHLLRLLEADTAWRGMAPASYRGGGMWDGSNRHGVRREGKPTPGYKLARRFFTGCDRGQILAKLADLSTLTGRTPRIRRAGK